MEEIVERINASFERVNTNADRAFAAIEEMSKGMAESKAKVADAEAKVAEAEAKLAAAMTRLTETIADTEKYRKESQRDFNERYAKVEASIKEMSKRADTVSRELGFIGNSLGTLVEFIVVPGIRPQMNALGHNFRYIAANKAIKVSGQRKAEIDLFLHNGAEAMAVEIKTSLSIEDVTTHINRLKTLRKHENEANIQNKVLYGAVIGVLIDEKARKLALKNGLYVAEILEAEDTMRVEEPRRRGTW